MTEFEKQIAKKKYQEMLTLYKRKRDELRQLHIELVQQRSLAGVNDPVPGEFTETPEEVR